MRTPTSLTVTRHLANHTTNTMKWLGMPPCLFVACLCTISGNNIAHAFSVSQWTRSIKAGFQQRTTADPNFAFKSVTELVLASSTQLFAEWNTRGASHFCIELDFVVAGVLTAVAGKYYSMWRVAPTRRLSFGTDVSPSEAPALRLGNMLVPSNAFQTTLLDGVTEPTIYQRLGSLIASAPPLFRAGCVASMIGYGMTYCMISIRSLLLPDFQAKTQTVNILYASLYTGIFMSVVSNLRYQVLQGLIEPAIDRVKKLSVLHAVLIFGVRLLNGFLGSMLAIAGMRYLGLQKRIA